MTKTLLAFTLIASSAFAQQPAAQTRAAVPAAQAAAPVDARFAAWLGCWRLEDDLAGTGARMCITPDKSGVRLQTVIGVQKGIDEVVIPDGVARPIVDAECKGTERAEFSADGARVFRSTDVTCGTEAPRTVKSVAFMAPGPSWINIQHVSGAAANTSVRVQRYRRAANQQLADGSRAQQPSAQLATRTTPDQTAWNIEDIVEAHGKLPLEAVQAVLTELDQKFELNRKTLVALDEAGVSEPVIDLMVALTYPERFVVERRGGGSAPSGIMTGSGWFDPFMSPILMGGMADCYSPLGYGYRSYYSMCGLGLYDRYGYNTLGYNYYNPYGYYGGGWINVSPQIAGGVPIEPQTEGRVVRGQGFTQIRNREAEPAPRINGGSNGGAWSGASVGGATSGSGFSSGSSGGSSGGGGGDAGGGGARVAVPKGGGQ
ncbi:MAG TPA: hypothetical protein VEA16_10680 [Vicinamibacterales bacterium]|nr:hypothetical protein [Vicinamibacterales bacterium]